jgi:hypothetical protein
MSVIITKNTPAEYLINSSPQVLNYMIRKGICGIRCAFPLTGTLEQLAKEKNFSDSEIDKIIIELNSLIKQMELNEPNSIHSS